MQRGLLETPSFLQFWQQRLGQLPRCIERPQTLLGVFARDHRN